MNDLRFTPKGWDDFEWWLDHDRATLKKVRALIKETRRAPLEGTGKPERLKYYDVDTVGEVWSRRVTQEHRFVYEVRDGLIVVLSLRHHY